jgi:hypothetical protein
MFFNAATRSAHALLFVLCLCDELRACDDESLAGISARGFEEVELILVSLPDANPRHRLDILLKMFCARRPKCWQKINL